MTPTSLPPRWRFGLAGLCLSLLSACASWHDTASTPLYRQLGGEAGITAVIDRTLERVSTDPRSRRTFEGIKMPYLKKSVAAHVCRVADGPCVYEGETMARAHGDLGITGAEFDLMVQVLREELDAAGASTAAKNELLRRLAPMRRDIVQH
ncbi:MAG TPA: group 1 truncated hemoglobin [Aquabacterium sp.]|uniref:group I truncated hemoglobin n=1 Tax=Aquabacterium sp. TaxID=1872578 RepID=UPI002E2FBD71|nr:group 1 truncated hemoglobin [Aquabacterium sp.]HEX5372425.1 group 1 truncated hemoglobin [Aquabacterium sp.]